MSGRGLPSLPVHRSEVSAAKASRGLGIGIILLWLALSGIAQGSEVTPFVQVKGESGAVRGVIENNLVVFRGMPYAKPPVGDLRWRAPQPVDAWKGVRDARSLSADCMQAPFGPTPPRGRHPVAEDCLYLNIWRPASAARKLPVMVWIHGGAFVNGGASSPDSTGEGIAARGAVFVSFNYRLGRFGFFGFPALNQEHPEEAKGNFGLMDQIAALRWVRRNIESFGGDASNITVVGESAGGISINMLLTSPATRGLFERAIIQSGAGRKLVRTRFLERDTADAISATTIGAQFAKSKGITATDAAALARLRALSADEITGGLNMLSLLAPDRALFSGPVLDGKLFIESPEAAYAAGRQHPVPIIVGATSADLGGDRAMLEPARFIARSMSRLRQPVYAYRFSYVLAANRASSPQGAQHATDVPFAFDLLSAVHGANVTPEDRRVAAAMCDYWVAFASRGDPNGAGRPTWPTYSAETDQILEFTSSAALAAHPDPWRARLDEAERLNTLP